jgi:type III pantothenate kinase
MIVAIDIGNTNITFGLFKKDSDKPVHFANINTDRQMTTDDLAIKYNSLKELWKIGGQDGTEQVVICSVVPVINYEFVHMFEKYYRLKPSFVSHKDVPLKLNYDYPAEIGTDRIINALAGITLFPGENLIIVDFGTATTFDIVSKEKVYEGGLIMTGIISSLRALEEKAAKLPHIDLSIPSGLVGKNTVDGIRSGIINGNGSMVDELVRRIKGEMKWDKARVIATGGLSRLIQHSAKLIDIIDQQLTLKGLYYFWKNQND